MRDPPALPDEREQLLLKERDVDQVDGAAVQRRLERLVERGRGPRERADSTPVPHHACRYVSPPTAWPTTDDRTRPAVRRSAGLTSARKV
ncbi:MAG TPA: hypothetical protein VJO34_00460 [Methylomirabilota bacterium]|nr:hypothetical protein [Methylomirabilota bacterium]